jgi:hypothetical protein
MKRQKIHCKPMRSGLNVVPASRAGEAPSLLHIKLKNLRASPINSYPNNVMPPGVAWGKLPDIFNHTLDRYRINLND